MKQFVLDYLTRECGKTERVVTCARGMKEADMTIDLQAGKRIAVYVINRAIRVPEIRERLEQNTLKRLHTLFILDGRMMPAENAEVEPPFWMAALHALAHGRVYAYWCEGREVLIRPVHLDWKWGSSPRTTAYGPSVALDKLKAEWTQCTSKYISGHYATADFGEGQFWKKRDPMDYRQYKYSWRQWSYQSSRQERPDTQEEWEPWEEFSQHYGETGDYDFADAFRSQQQRQSRRSKPTVAVSSREYALLGVKDTASLDEVKQAYRRMARAYHPDLHPEEKEKYTLKMAEINAAFEAISRQRKDA
jgi:hypothetical protein